MHGKLLMTGVLVLGAWCLTTALAERGPQDNWIVEHDLVWPIRRLGYSQAVAAGEGKVFVSGETDNHIEAFLQDGTFLHDIADGELSSARGVAYHDGCVYIADTGHHMIQVYEVNGNFVTNWGTQGSGAGQLETPYGIAVDSEYVYCTETGNDRLQIFDHAGNHIRMWGEFGQVAGQFIDPRDVAVDRQYVYVADGGNQRIQVFEKDGTFVRSWGHTLDYYGTVDFNSVASDGHNVYATACYKDSPADRFRNWLWVWDKLGNRLERFFWRDTKGYHDGARGVGVESPFIFISSGEVGEIRVFRRISRSLGELPLDRVPLGSVLTMSQREGTFILDVDYHVIDPDDSNLTVYAAAFVGEVDTPRSLDTIVPMRTFIEGTDSNIGPGIQTGTVHRLSWDMEADGVSTHLPDYGDLKVSLLAKDDRDLLDLHLLELPAVDARPAVTINREPLHDDDLLPVWFWWLAAGDSQISLSSGTVHAVSGVYSNQVLAAGTNTTAVGREFLFGRLDLREATADELQHAREATTPGSVTKRDPRRPPPATGYKVNEFNFVTEPTNGWWVVPVEP